MKMKDAIKLGIGVCIGESIYELVKHEFYEHIGDIQDFILDRSWFTDDDRDYCLNNILRNTYAGTKYRKRTVTNKKNPIGFV